ncbi:MAG: tetratricopeptide repeat protein [Planctomycetaceae bacterium]
MSPSLTAAARITLAELLLQSNEIEEAMLRVDEVLAAEPVHADALRIHAALLAKSNRREEAIEDYTRLISSGAALNADAVAQSFLDRGRLQLEGEEWSAATEDLTKYLEVYPDDADALTLRARALLSQNETGKAITDLTLALLKAPEAADLYTLRAEAFEQLNEPAAALADLQKAAILQPDDSALHQKLAERFFQDRQFGKSAKTLDSLAASNAGQLSPEQRLLRGRARLADGNLSGAYEDACALAEADSTSPGSVKSEDDSAAGQDALHRHDDVEALRLIRNVPEETLTPDARLLYGQTLARQSHPDEAIRIFSNLLNSDASNTAALLSRATVFLDTSDWQAASNDASLVLRQLPDNPRALQIKGISLFQNDRFREALETLEHPELLSRDTNDSRWMRIQCCDELKLTFRELEELNMLLGIAPTHEAARLLRAELLEKLGHFDDAVADLSVVLQKNPANLSAMTDRALLNQRRGDAAAAVADFSKAIELSPNDAELYYRRGIARHQLGQSDDARQDLDKAILLNSHVADAWYVIGNIEAGRGQSELALAAYAKAVEVRPEHAAAWYNRGNLLFSQSKMHQAIDCWTIAISIQPELFRAYNNRAAAYDRMDQDTDAVADYEKTLELNPGFVRAWDNLAWLLATSDNKTVRDPERAVKLATKACELSEYKDWACLNTLATSCAENQEFDAAVKWARQARAIAPEADRKELDQLVAAYEARVKSKRVARKPGGSVR